MIDKADLYVVNAFLGRNPDLIPFSIQQFNTHDTNPSKKLLEASVIYYSNHASAFLCFTFSHINEH